MTEREHWLAVKATDEDIRENIFDPSINLEKIVEAVVRDFPKNPKMILEIGSGTGRITREIKKLYPDAFVKGYDVNPAMLEEACRLSGYKKSSNPSSDRVPLYYEINKIFDKHTNNREDAIYSVCVFQHLPTEEKREYIDDAYKLLNKDGVLTVQFVEGNHDSFVNHTCSMQDMKDWFESAGFFVSHIGQGAVHETWSWITGVKR